MEGDRTLVDVARVAMERLAPEEMPLFDDTVRAWLRQGRRSRRGSDDMLGFGIDAAQPVMTVAALTAAAAALKFLGAATADAGQKGTSELILSGARRLLARVRGRRAAGGAEPDASGTDRAERLSPSQLATVRELMCQRLRATGLSVDQAALVADAVIGALAISEGEATR